MDLELEDNKKNAYYLENNNIYVKALDIDNNNLPKDTFLVTSIDNDFWIDYLNYQNKIKYCDAYYFPKVMNEFKKVFLF